MMKEKKLLFLLLGAWLPAAGVLSAQDSAAEVRTIRLLQDDAQLRLASKVYELKYVKAADIRPYIEAAVKRFHSKSKTERVNYSAAKRNFLIVSTGENFLPYVDDLIAKIDRPGKTDKYGSILEGTGITRIAYTPNYRAAEDIVRIINGAIKTSEGYAYLNKDTNTIYWKDDKLSALAILAWVKALDRPVPQVNLHLNYYEVRESKLRDIGVDYLAWRNGPGLNLFEAAYSGGDVFSNEAILQLISGVSSFTDIAKNFSTSWGYGGFFTAPQFDLSFIRLLQQSGNAKLAANTNLTFVNTALYEDPSLNQYRTYRATLTPDYQNIVKDDDDRSSVVTSGKAAFDFVVNNPVICFGAETGEINSIGHIPSNEAFYRKDNGGVVFQYQLLTRDVVERNNRGDELGNSSYTTGSLTLGFKTEKLLSSYVRETEAEETIGIPFLVKIPVLKYLFGTTTTLKEKTYIIVTAEANLVHPELLPPSPVSREVIMEDEN
ncbi:MAG: Bacterial type II/III secretion system short domain protein [Lentisphaerae bacterium ADurb.Bin242]|nr:MAG: Bacterial type II/III secretion system short domain protein [Lentisphaerae bacterium ADurb.Bin242]